MASIHVGDALAYSSEISDLAFETIRIKIATFTTLYICAKLLIVAYMVNFYIWAASPLAVAQSNVLTTKIALTVFGVFFISLPRYYIEYQWHLFKWRSGELQRSGNHYEDLRSPAIRLLAFFADATLIGGFVAGVWLQPMLAKFFE